MKSLKSLVFILATAGCAFAASYFPTNPVYSFQSNKSIDLIFANGFEAVPITTLVSETPFIGSLPALETGHETVGTSALSFSVDPSGQAGAVYPIFAGVGTAGVAPTVSLRYSSSAGDGHIGVGWSITGVTVISRCRETFESKDGAGAFTPSPITFGAEDKFCLNGERLFAVSGSYGQNATEYRTEKEQFARVISYDTTNGDNNPDYFTVERKDGSISHYGNTVDSNTTITSDDIQVDGNTNTWAINRYQDTYGNYIEYSYSQYDNGEFTLSDIDYTGNDSAIPVLPTYNNIHFTYENRSKVIRSYVGGVTFDISKRLASVQSSIDGIEVRDYTLNYGASTTSSRDLLSSILECRDTACLPLTLFDWSTPNRQFKSTTSATGTFPTDVKSSKLGDTNGDARGDLVFVDESENVFKVAYAAGYVGFGITASTGISAPFGDEIDNKWHLIDYNADGKQDLMKQSGGQWVVHLAQTFGISSTPIFTGLTAAANSDFKVVDLNGDGLTDLLYPQAGLSVRYLERVGNSYQFSNSVVGLQLPSNYNQIAGIPAPPSNPTYLVYQYYQDDDINFYTPDVNGDGVADLVLRADVYYTEFPNPNSVDEENTYYFLSAGEDVATLRGEPLDLKHSSQWVAFVGNGLNGNGKLNYYSENYFIESASVNGGDDDEIKFIDINADGLIDVVNKVTNNDWEFRLGNGKGFTDSFPINTINNEEHIQFFDHDLDGYLDLVFPSNNTNNPYVFRKWNGTTFNGTNLFTGSLAKNLNQNINLFLDFDGDGAADHLRIDGAGSQKLYPRQEAFKGADKITSFTNGMGASTEVLYQPLTFSTTYSQGNHQTATLNWGNGSPVLDLMGAIYVVKQVTTDAPIEGDEDAITDMRYRYVNARVQAGGRGFLGFEKVITETPVKAAGDMESKILETTTTYRQDFPFNGLPASTVVKQLDANYYGSDNIPPSCDDDVDCFPDPCIPGEICYDPQRAGITETVLSEVINTPQSTQPTNKSHFAYIETSETKTYNPDDGSLLKTTTQSSTHDTYGNPLTSTVSIKDKDDNTLQTNSTTNTYTNSITGKWHIGLLETSTTSKTRTGQATVTTSMAYDYDVATTGLLKEERYHNDEVNTVNSDLFLRVQYEYDQYGNNLKVRSCTNHISQSACRNENFTAPDITKPHQVNRYNRLTFDVKGRYIDATYNTSEHKISDVATRDIYGNPLTTIDILGRTTTSTYDTFGRLTSSRNSIGEWSQISRSWCAGMTGSLSCPTDRNSSIRIRKQASGGALSYSYLDKLGREIATIGQSFNVTDDNSTTGDERYVFNQVWFDALGRQVKTEGPYFLGSDEVDKPSSETQYDRYARPTLMTLPDGSTQTVSYDGLGSTFTNGKGQRKKEVKNALGQLITVNDFDESGSTPNYKNTLSYNYNSQGLVSNIKRTTDSGIEMLSESFYDKGGRKYSFNDVDSGLVLSSFNAEGEVIETEDANGQVLKNYYDNLGRAFRSESYDGTTRLTTTINTYNAGNGLLTKSQRYLGTETLADYTEDHNYDSYKRPASTDISIKDTTCGGLNCNYTNAIYYDKYSRIKYQQDASTKAIQNHYTPRGFIDHITDAADSEKEYYRINKTGKWGNVTQDTRADNIDMRTDYTYHSKRGWIHSIDSIHQSQVYEFDVLGNLGKRADLDNNQSECFLFDRLNRLTDTYRFDNFAQACGNTSGNVEHQSISYDGRGNITSKDNQTYTYNTALTNAIGASPHQVQTKGLQSFEYDDNGNNTLTTNFTNKSGFTTSRNIEYNAYDKATRIYTGSSNSPLEESFYRYNTAEQRFSRIDKNNQGEVTTTHFIGNVEIEYNHNGQIAYKRQLGNYAILTETNGSTQETYLFSDHLGSVDVITDKNGKVLQRMSFSAWGERRLPHDWDAIPVTDVRNYLSDYTTRGFTGHEMVDTFGIINMGGRLYDAALGRVLQADPFVQEPTNSQSYNRYTYVFNNPVSYTDPSGYLSAKQFLGIVVGIVMTILLGPLATTLWKAILVGFASGFVSGAIITGSLKGALKSGLIGAAVAGVMFQVTGGPAEAGDTKSATPGGAKDSISSNSFEGANSIADSTATATTEAVEAVVQQGGNTASQSVSGQIEVSYATSVDPNAIDLGTYSPFRGSAGLALETYSFLKDNMIQALMVGAVSNTLANLWIADFKFGVNAPQNLWDLGVEMESLVDSMTFVNNKYDQLIYDGLEFADNVSIAMGVVGLARGVVKNYSKKYLYRAVSQAELDDIAKFGLRTNGASGYETGKLFAKNIDDAVRFGKNNFKFDGIPNHIIKVEVPRSVIANSFKFTADSMAAISIESANLHLLKSTIIKFSPVRL